MGTIRVSNLGKAYKQYPNRWSRLVEWISPFRVKRHELKWVLKDINFNIAPGESVGIIGYNGAGKSTLLKLITGTNQPTCGEASVEGRVAALLELGMGFHPDFTGRQNAVMSGQLMGLSVEEITALMPQIESFAEIGDYIDQPVRVYSSGMQVRLAFAAATAVRPDILIVDEALAVGDVFFQQKCFERIRSFCEAGTTLLFVSHAMSVVYSLCDRAIMIDGGRLEIDGSPREVIDLYNAKVLQRQNGADHDMQIVTGRHEARENETPTSSEEPLVEMDVPDAPAIGSFSSQGVTIRAVEVLAGGRPVSAVVSDSDATVRIQVQFDQSFSDPHVGFQIRNAMGEAIFMTNTYCMHRSIGAVHAGDAITIEFSFKAALSPGDYTVTTGVADGGVGETTFRRTLARLQDARAFTILRNLDAILWHGICNLDPTCKVRRTGREAPHDA
ncbi:MAG: transporter ATP-binding protein [Paucimonas sp.]|jgi:lipopolysaccharide transport system ATP-binding protein|nr:transporter ATP-binding protein [Paucimonas sp.]